MLCETGLDDLVMMQQGLNNVRICASVYILSASLHRWADNNTSIQPDETGIPNIHQCCLPAERRVNAVDGLWARH